MEDKIKYALITNEEKYGEEIGEYFKENIDVHLVYSLEKVQGKDEVYAQLNDIDARIPLRAMSDRLERWLTPYNDLYISACSDIFYDISELSGLRVGLIDFSDLTISSKDKTTILQNSEVREIRLPKFTGNISRLSNILLNVKVHRELEVGSHFEKAKINDVGSLFLKCAFSTLDLSILKLGWVVNFNDMLSHITADVLILPKELGSERVTLSFRDFFGCSEIREIQGLDEFPWDKAVYTSWMFAEFRKGKIVIKDNLKRVEKADWMFFRMSGVEVKLLEVESLPYNPNWFWFSEVENCKIYLPKFVGDEDGIVESFRKLDDTNEIFCSEAFVKKMFL